MEDDRVARAAAKSVLLLSGGMDSVALAYQLRPGHALFIDYGQRAAKAEQRAASAVCAALGLDFESITVDLRPMASGLMAGGDLLEASPSPEWWPFRNQLLISIAAAWLISHSTALAEPGTAAVLVGSVFGDGERHADGTERFFRVADELLRLQEGRIAVTAPAIELSTEDLVTASGVPDSILAWSHSCHVADLPCGDCPGCYKRERVLTTLRRLA